MNTTKLTLGQAAKEVVRSKATVSNAIKSGRLSATKNDKGAFEIDPSELFRVFTRTANANASEPEPNTIEHSNLTVELAEKVARLEAERDMLREQLDDARSDRDEWREESKRKTLLLEHQTKPTPRRGLMGWLRGDNPT